MDRSESDNLQTRLKCDAASEVFEEKKRKKRSFDLLLEICKEGLADALSREKILSESEPTSPGTRKEDSFYSLPAPGSVPPFSPYLSSFTEVQKGNPVSAVPASCTDLFDKLCCEMLVMTGERSTQTTLVLQTDAFLNSPFYGATVMIEEFSTAPKIFNVSIKGTTEAISLLQTHTASFFRLLETRNFSFAIHRIDTDLLVDSRHNKEDPLQDEQDTEDS